VSYGPGGLAVIDWNCAVVVDRRPEEALAVLEFANVELVEMRFLEDRLDRSTLATASCATGRCRCARGSWSGSSSR